VKPSPTSTPKSNPGGSRRLGRCSRVCWCSVLVALFAGLVLPERSAGAQALLPRGVPDTSPAGTPAASSRELPTPPKRNFGASPHGDMTKEAVANTAPDLARGQIEVRVIDPRRPEQLAGRKIVLNVLRQSIEQGNTSEEYTATTDERGVARFDGRETHGDFQYSVKTSEGPANYVTPPFAFQQTGGVRVFLPVFPVTQNMTEAVVLSRGLVAVMPRDEVFSFDVLWRIENFGRNTWVPKDVVFPLPPGWKAFTAEEMQGDGRFVANDSLSVKLEGTFPPGKHDLLFRFQLPNEGKSNLQFTFPTFLNVALFKVMVDASPTMSLKAEGLEAPQETRNRDGQRRIVAGRDFLSEKKKGPDQITVEIAGIPTASQGRLVAAALAGAIVLAGFGQALGRRRGAQPSRTTLSVEDLKRAGDLLLDELIELEQAFEQGAIGRKMRDRTRQQLLEAFARLGAGEVLAPDHDDDADDAVASPQRSKSKPSTAAS
jgi:hypothetical protein